jgi:hypothetical protein
MLLQEIPMNRSERPVGRFRLFSSFVVAAATAVVLSPQAQADDDLFDPAVPPIVVGGTVDTQATVVVDPQTPASVDTPPVVTGTGPRKPTIDRFRQIVWFPDAKPPVVAVEERRVGDWTFVYLDNHGRYWRRTFNADENKILEQIGGWPAPPPPPPSPETPRPNLPSALPSYGGCQWNDTHC